MCKLPRKMARAGERRRWHVWPSSEGGIWYVRATMEDGMGERALSGGKWCAADDGEERRKKSERRGRKCIKSQFY